MPYPPPYWRRLVVVGLAVVAILALIAAIPPRHRPPSYPSGHIFDAKSAPYRYFDELLGWQDYVYTARPVYQSREDFPNVWSAGEEGCYALTPAAVWDAVPDLRGQVAALMERFEDGSYSYDPESLADLPTFSATCAPGQQRLVIEMADLGADHLGEASVHGLDIRLAMEADSSRPDGIDWCPSVRHEDGSCYYIDAILMHELGHILGLGHSSPGPGPGPALTVMSVEATMWEQDNSPQFGECDMAGLQARYGLAGPDSKLSVCLPLLNTRVTLSQSGDRLTATLAVDPSALPAGERDVVWFDGEPPEAIKGRWETLGLDGQLVHSAVALELWRHDGDGASAQDSLVAAMTYTDSPWPTWVVDAPLEGGTFFARFAGDASLLADDSDYLTTR